jgi:hypothetical protein
MSKRSVRRTETILDPAFFIPEGVDELVYDDNDEFSSEEEELLLDDTDVLDPDIIIGDETTDDSAAVPVPEDITIVSQKLGTGPGGQQVVDVVVNVKNIAGVEKFEFRITKA